MTEISIEDRAELRKVLVKRFNIEELKSLCFNLGVDYEMFPHATKSEFTRGLIGHFERRQNLGLLAEEMVKERPSETGLVELLSRFGDQTPREKVQMVLPQALLDKLDKRKVLSEIANALGISRSEVNLIAAAAGSVHLLIGLPTEHARQLVSLQPQYIGDHVVASVVLFSDLSAAAQEAWKLKALADWSNIGSFIPGFTGPWILRVLVWLGAGFLAVSAASATLPHIKIVNRCRIAIEQSWPVPVIGEVRISIPPGGEDRYLIPPGRYTVTYTEQGELLGHAPLLNRFGPFAAEELPILLDGESLTMGQTLDKNAGMFDDFELILCP